MPAGDHRRGRGRQQGYRRLERGLPAEHWTHLRSADPIESAFATVRLRTTKTKRCLSRKTALAMVFKLLLSAAKKWRRRDGSDHLAEVIPGARFEDGIKQIQNAA